MRVRSDPRDRHAPSVETGDKLAANPHLIYSVEIIVKEKQSH